MKLELTNSLQSPIIQMFLALALAVITWVALDASFFERMSPGTFIAFFGAAAMLPRPVRYLSLTNAFVRDKYLTGLGSIAAAPKNAMNVPGDILSKKEASKATQVITASANARNI